MQQKENILLSVEDLTVEYTSNKQVVHAVNGVSFKVERGKCLCLVGETGAGKTTIAKSILRILPTPQGRIVSGSISFDGKDVVKMKENELMDVRGSDISMIFQDPMTALNPLMTVGEQVAEVIELHYPELSPAEIRDKATEMLGLVGITRERYHDYPHQFSGGMKQRVVIAIALACRPRLLLADEPTTALDVTLQSQILDLIRELQQERETAMIFITHDLGVVAEISDYVAIVYAGQIVEYGPREKIFRNPTHPYTIGLIYSLPEMNIGKARLECISGVSSDPVNLPEGCYFHPRCAYATDECRSGTIPLGEVSDGHFCRCCNRKEEQPCLQF